MIEEIDIVQQIRDMREKHWNEIKDLSREEQKKEISERNARAFTEHEKWKNYYAEKSEENQ